MYVILIAADWYFIYVLLTILNTELKEIDPTVLALTPIQNL